MIMGKFIFQDYIAFACHMSDELDELTNGEIFSDVTVVGKYEETKQIIKELVNIGHDLFSIVLAEEEVNGYKDVYVLTLTNEGIWCEPMLRETGYITVESDSVYIFSNCSSTVIKHCKGDSLHEISIGENVKDKCVDEDCECSSHLCECDVECNGKSSFTNHNNINSNMLNITETIESLVDNMERINELLREMENFRKLFKW